MRIVMKFGGTSVGSAERIAEAAKLAVSSAEQGHQVVVVTSAMSGVTNALIDAAHAAAKGQWDQSVAQKMLDRHKSAAAALAVGESARADAAVDSIARRVDRFEKLCFGLSMVHELTPRLLDAISGTGEMLAAPLVAGAIAAHGRPSTAIDATEVVVTTD